MLEKAETNISGLIEEVHEQKRGRIENFLTEVIAERLGWIETLLTSVGSNPLSSIGFTNDEGTWKAAGDLIFSNKWVDFLQNSTNGKLGSALVVEDQALRFAQKVSIASESDAIAKVILSGKEWVAVSIPLTLTQPMSTEEKQGSMHLYLLFSQEQLSLLGQVHFDASSMNELALLTSELERRLHLASGPLHWLPVSRAQNIPALEKPNGIGQLFLEKVRSLHDRSDLITMIHALTVFFSQPLFGVDPTSPSSPLGITLFLGDEEAGRGVLLTSILDETALPKTKEPDDALKTLPFNPIVIDRGGRELYLGASLPLLSKNNRSDLTIGVSINGIAKLLSQAVNLPVFCVYEGSIFLLGSPWDDVFKHFPLQETLNQTYGVATADGNELFFFQMQPIPGIDLHFYTVNLASKEFAVLDSVKEGATLVIEGVSQRMWVVALAVVIIVLVLLNRLAKRITDPISKLATATSALRGGRLLEIDLPKIHIKRKDEVQTLYLAFSDMVQSLKDKERVRAVLNKVVSPTIANEILKSDMKLGGEKKRVCVMFADIRGFTKMTETMEPEHVIVMLNHCMTKVAMVVDERGGLIDKYVGDAVMALFGIPQIESQDTVEAVEAAYEIQSVLHNWNKERQQQGKPLIHMGIGIDIGDVIAGNMGAEDRQNYTVLGSHVNMAARLCSMANPGQILLSEAVAKSQRVSEQFTIREIGKEMLKGFSEPTPVYEVVRRCSIT